jgi:hypothetical protein
MRPERVGPGDQACAVLQPRIGPRHDHERRTPPGGQRCGNLLLGFLKRDQCSPRRPEGARQRGIFQCQTGDPGRLQLLDTPHRVQGIAKSVVSVDQQRQYTRPADAPAQRREFVEGQQRMIRRPQHRQGGHRSTQHAQRKPKPRRRLRRQRIKDRRGPDTGVTRQDRPQQVARCAGGHTTI